MQLRILTPEAEVLNTAVTAVTIPGVNGELQVLPGHTQFLTLVNGGEVVFDGAAGAASGKFLVEAGHAEVNEDVVTIAVDKATSSPFGERVG